MVNREDIKLVNDFSSEAYLNLRNTTGWRTLSTQQIDEVILDNSLKCAMVYDNKVIGICRAINDNSHLYLICDVIIDPTYQGLGLGIMLVESILDRIKQRLAGKYGRIYIMSCKGKEGFYKKLGFREDIATGLSIEINEEQE